MWRRTHRKSIFHFFKIRVHCFCSSFNNNVDVVLIDNFASVDASNDNNFVDDDLKIVFIKEFYISNIIIFEKELNAMRNVFECDQKAFITDITFKNHTIVFSMFSLNLISLSELNTILHIVRMTFFTFFSRDKVFFNENRSRLIENFDDYIKHLFHYKNDRFV